MTTIPGITVVNDINDINGQPEWVEFTNEAFELMEPKRYDDFFYHRLRWLTVADAPFSEHDPFYQSFKYRRHISSLTAAQREKIFGDSQGKESVTMPPESPGLPRPDERKPSPEIAEAKVGAESPIVIELPHSERQTEWGVSFGGLYPTDDQWIACATQEKAERLCRLVKSLNRLTKVGALDLSFHHAISTYPINHPTKGGDEKCDIHTDACALPVNHQFTATQEPLSSNSAEETKAGDFNKLFDQECKTCLIKTGTADHSIALHFAIFGKILSNLNPLPVPTPKPEALPLTVQNLSLRSRTVGQLTSHKGAESGAGSYSEAHKLAEHDLRERFDEWWDGEVRRTRRWIYSKETALNAVLHFQGFDKGGGE